MAGFRRRDDAGRRRRCGVEVDAVVGAPILQPAADRQLAMIGAKRQASCTHSARGFGLTVADGVEGVGGVRPAEPGRRSIGRIDQLVAVAMQAEADLVGAADPDGRQTLLASIVIQLVPSSRAILPVSMKFIPVAVDRERSALDVLKVVVAREHDVEVEGAAWCRTSTTPRWRDAAGSGCSCRWRSPSPRRCRRRSDCWRRRADRSPRRDAGRSTSSRSCRSPQPGVMSQANLPLALNLGVQQARRRRAHCRRRRCGSAA